jgi:hypothetical protein
MALFLPVNGVGNLEKNISLGKFTLLILVPDLVKTGIICLKKAEIIILSKAI